MDAVPVPGARPLIPVSGRRLARDIAEMVQDPYPNTRLIPNPSSLARACLLLDTGTRVLHVNLLFMPKYPKDFLWCTINDYYDGIEGRCANFLMELRTGTEAYTIKTFAIHLLSMFDGDYELQSGLDGAEDEWVLTEWDHSLAPASCDSCGWYRGVHRDIVHQDADKYSGPNTTGAIGPSERMLIRELPDELLIRILRMLEDEDLLRFGQAYKKVKRIIEEDVFIRDRELQCFVTKEHFEKSSLGIGICLPQFPQQSGRAMESEFDLVSEDAYHELPIFKTAYGCRFTPWLPLPLNKGHWDRVKDIAYEMLHRLADLPSVGRQRGLSDCMDVLTAFMEDQVTKLFMSEIRFQPTPTSLLRPSEKGIESLFFLFHLLLCAAVDNPEYVAKANKMIRDFQSDNARLKDMPSPGRLLAALLISDDETDANFMRKLFWEAVTRNVPRLLANFPEMEYLELAASSRRLKLTFLADLARYRAFMFLDLFQRKVRSAHLGQTPDLTEFADILKAKRNFLFHRRGFPTPALLATLAAELPRIRAVDSFTGLLNYLGVYRNAGEVFLVGKLRDTVRECFSRGDRTPWTLSREDGAALRLAVEEESSLPESEYLRSPLARLTSELDH